MMAPTESDLAEAIYRATAAAAADLFRDYPDHHFYWYSLTTTGEAHAPCPSAWSTQALAEAARTDEDWLMLKWSYADSPFYFYGGQHFAAVDRLFQARPQIDACSEEAWACEYELRLRAMEAAMARLDHEGLFGVGQERLRIVITVEVAPPDHTNTERAMRLNPPEALTEWLAEAAEPAPDPEDLLPWNTSIYIDQIPLDSIKILIQLRRILGTAWPFSDLRGLLASQPLLADAAGDPRALRRKLDQFPELRPYLFFEADGRLESVWPQDATH
ncbi:hypothetical protein Rhe02_73280 [Rhizocola hellebori]|uniref:DUF4303 domain-containing protein n=1 Tax=Rhizocola hellebori TaxID=1392758 RepID=A0A8J3QH90_9ACTN|nr:DUF4303 domain-containing protein [Rhizocola hellebori]GIH09261.1 hypothetical protein Rhe02_73280 [Rhizocola hellebori]